MIFAILYALMLAGYSAIGLLLGSYLLEYTGASQFALGLIFMLQPFTIFARPFICAQADRYQSHKQLLKYCLGGASIFYLPYIALPYALKFKAVDEALTFPIRFGLLSCAHLLGSVCYCGIRSLCDALAVNYAKRIGTEFTVYRKWGTISMGFCGFSIGQINQNWIMPNFVPALAVFSICMFISMVLVHIWPDEYFEMIGDRPLPVGRDLLRRIGSKLRSTLLFCSSPADEEKSSKISHAKAMKEAEATRYLSAKQQISIFWLLIKRDFRLPLYLILLTFGGLVGYAPQNFVYTYMNISCRSKGNCDAAFLAGLTIISYCAMETSCYLIINLLRGRLGHIFMLQLTFVSLAFHYYFYAFILDHVSPYYFLVESLHGLEYSFSLAASMDLAYKFSSEVELLIPELIQRGVISERDDLRLVKVSVKALTTGCTTTAYDGIGTMIGAFMLGLVAEKYSFNTTWFVNATTATTVFVVVLVVVLVGKCCQIKPQIEKVRQDSDSDMANV